MVWMGWWKVGSCQASPQTARRSSTRVRLCTGNQSTMSPWISASSISICWEICRRIIRIRSAAHRILPPGITPWNVRYTSMTSDPSCNRPAFTSCCTIPLLNGTYGGEDAGSWGSWWMPISATISLRSWHCQCWRSAWWTMMPSSRRLTRTNTSSSSTELKTFTSMPTPAKYSHTSKKKACLSPPMVGSPCAAAVTLGKQAPYSCATVDAAPTWQKIRWSSSGVTRWSSSPSWTVGWWKTIMTSGVR
mmetsp:Transcript_21827/g.55775  ORF Transcript_21827/g.55775 Transcript_21827/m.55775 type:complete len:247 (-) Transcript_21827:336-1076(-)